MNIVNTKSDNFYWGLPPNHPIEAIGISGSANSAPSRTLLRLNLVDFEKMNDSDSSRSLSSEPSY